MFVRSLSSIALLAVLLSACGAPGASAPAASPEAAASEAAASVEPSSAAEESAAPSAALESAAPSASTQASSAASADDAASGATRSYTDASGQQMELPEAPQRVVTLTERDLDGALAVGVTPVGSVNGRGQAGLPAYLGGQTEGIESVGSLAEPSLEKVAALDPDLILVGAVFPELEKLLPQLRELAPLAVTHNQPDDWKTALQGTAAALNREAEAEAFLAEYESRLAEVQAQLPADGPGEASVVRWNPDGPVIMAPSSFSSLVLADLGIQRPAKQAELVGSHGAHSDTLSLEQLDLIDADWLFVGALNPDGSATLESARSNPLFQNLEVVKNNRVALVDGAVWTSVGGAIAALSVLDDVEAALSGTGADASAAAETSAATATFPLTIRHQRGELTLNAPAQRVVALEWTYVEDLLALGVQPVAIADIEGYNSWVKVPVALDASVQDVGLRGEPNLEALAALKPDLIIDVAFRADANYDELNAIAPTLIFEPYPADQSLTQYDEMLETFNKLAAATGRTAEATTVIEHMQATFAGLRERLEAAGQAGQPFVLSQAWTGTGGAEVRLFTENAMATQIIEQLGLENAWQDGFQQYGFSSVSVEALPELGDAHYFYVVQDNDDVFASDAVRPLWESLPFVKAGRAHALGGDTWLFGGPLSAELLATIVTDALTTN